MLFKHVEKVNKRSGQTQLNYCYKNQSQTSTPFSLLSPVAAQPPPVLPIINTTSFAKMVQFKDRAKILKRRRLLLKKKNQQTKKNILHDHATFLRDDHNIVNNLNGKSSSSAFELPQDLIFSEILTRLPVRSLTQFKLVSNKWHSMISSPFFTKSHLKMAKSNTLVPTKCVFIRTPYYFYILNYDAYDWLPYPSDGLSFGENNKGLVSVKSLSFYDNGVNTFLIGSFNGLVCFGRGSSFGVDYSFYVYNPVMGQSYKVMDPLGNFQGKLIYGFGYVACKDDYLLFVGGLQRRCSENYVYVYSVRGKVWRKIGAFSESEIMILYGGQGVLVNDTLHWGRRQAYKSSFKNHIFGFDLVNETFKDLALPKALVGDDHFTEHPKLCEMNGCLCAWGVDIVGGNIEMWMLKQYGGCDFWMKLFKIDMIPGLVNFYGLTTENGKVLVQTEEGSLLLVDLNQHPPKCTTIVKSLGSIEIVSYVRSLVSPYR